MRPGLTILKINLKLWLFFWLSYSIIADFSFIPHYYTFMYSFYLYTSVGIKFSGKGYRIFWTSRNSCIPNLGYSHFIIRYHFNVLPYSKLKYSYYLLGLGIFALLNDVHLIVNLRYQNSYTLRGFRILKNKVYKKIGKVSSYF